MFIEKTQRSRQCLKELWRHYACLPLIDENTGWAIGAGGTILKTTDGGTPNP